MDRLLLKTAVLPAQMATVLTELSWSNYVSKCRNSDSLEKTMKMKHIPISAFSLIQICLVELMCYSLDHDNAGIISRTFNTCTISV